MKQGLFLSNKHIVVLAFFVLVLSMSMLGCSGSNGSQGPAGPAGASAAATTGTVSGTVQNAAGKALSGIQVNAYASVTGGTVKAQVSPSDSYQRAKNHVASSIIVAQAITNASGQYTLANLAPGTYDIDFVDLTGTYTIGAMDNQTLTAGQTIPINAGMGGTSASVSTTSAAAGAPTVTVTPSVAAEVGFGNTVTLTAQATSPITGATLSYKWAGTYSVNPGGTFAISSTTNTATVTMPTLAQALGGVVTTNTAYETYLTIGGVNYDVPPFVQEARIGVLPILADTRGSVSAAVTVSDGLGGTATASVSSNAAATQTGLNNVPVGEPVYLNSGYSTPASNWSLTSIPSGSKAALTNNTTRNASFVPDIAGTYVVKDTGASASTTYNTLTIYAGTWQGVIKGGGVKTVTIPATGFTAFTAPSGGVSQVAVGVWATAAGTYTDFPYVTVDTGCTACHANNVVVNGLTAPDKFTPWAATAHATFFSRGLENITSNSGSCLTCHTLGYDQAPGAANNGFDDVALLDNWAYPTKQAGQWVSMLTSYPAVAQLSNIQCENCHGPQQSGGHISGMAGSSTGVAGGTRVSYSAEDCAICHADGTGHHLYSEWAASGETSTNSGHSKMAQLDAFGGHVRSLSPVCSRCHTAEGFTASVNQITNNKPGGALTGSASIITSPIVWTSANVHVQTCTACHDPHNDATPYQLRLYDSVKTTDGLTGSGFGAGAICIQCHNLGYGGLNCGVAATSMGICPVNYTAPYSITGSSVVYTSNNGTYNSDPNLTGAPFLHEDTDPSNNLYSAGTSGGTGHDNAMGDVLMGRNAFFMGTTLPMLSKHANVTDSCVGCHMTLNPTTHLSHGAPAVDTHFWYIADADRPTLCANCHGGTGDVSGNALVGQTTTQLAALAGTSTVPGTIGQAFLANLKASGITSFYVGGIANNVSTCGKPHTGTLVTVSQITSVTGTSSFTFHVSSGNPGCTGATTITSSTVAAFCTQNTDNPANCNTANASTTAVTTAFGLGAISKDAAGTQPLFPLNSVFKKAQWNYTLINNDKSYGIHNPTFVTTVLNNTIAALNAAATATTHSNNVKAA